MGRYTTTGKVKLSLRTPPGGTWAKGGVDDLELEAVIEAAEAQIDSECGGPINAGANEEERIFLAGSGPYLLTDAFTGTPSAVELLSVMTGESAGAVSYWRPDGREKFYVGRKALRGPWRQGREYQVSARWGHPRISPQVKEAATMWASRLWHKQLAPLGLIEGTDGSMAYAARIDRDILALIADWRTWGFE